MDARKPLKFPARAPPSKTNAINSGNGTGKSKGKGNQRSQSVPPAKTQQQKGSSQKKAEARTGNHQKESSSKTTPSPKPSPSPSTTSSPAQPKEGNPADQNKKRLPGRIEKQCRIHCLLGVCTGIIVRFSMQMIP